MAIPLRSVLLTIQQDGEEGCKPSSSSRTRKTRKTTTASGIDDDGSLANELFIAIQS